jgi:WhiB family transcriptional regulator, redox-sensing transcriptional regulator
MNDEWMQRAACHGKYNADGTCDFFAPEDDLDAIRRAKQVCAACPVWEQCYLTVLEDLEQPGVWAGYTRSERVRMRTARGPWTRRPVATKRPLKLSSAPLLAAIEQGGLLVEGMNVADRRALRRAKANGWVTDLVADRIAVKVLRLTLDEVYGSGWDEVAA